VTLISEHSVKILLLLRNIRHIENTNQTFHELVLVGTSFKRQLEPFLAQAKFHSPKLRTTFGSF